MLNPNASDLVPLRKWPSGRYVALARRLIERFPDLVVVMTGNEDESPAVGEMVRSIRSDRCVDVSGRTSLRELLTLMDIADAVVTNDSGPAHFSTLTSTNTITLFGPESPEIFGPRGPGAVNLWAGLACSPCVNAFNDRRSACTDNICMQRIPVEEVEAAVVRIVTHRSTTG